MHVTKVKIMKAFKIYWKERLKKIHDHIMMGCPVDECDRPWTKGLIIEGDDNGQKLTFVKESLNYEALKSAGKVQELAIDELWTPVAAVYHDNHGLLVLNVSNIKLFGLCWHLNQLAKQEYVLINFVGIKWSDVSAYAKEHCSDQFDAMTNFYQEIIY